MPLIACPGCGKQISDAAPACIHCGLPRGGGVPGMPPPKRKTEPWLIVLIVVAVGFGFVFVIGILAAIAIPKFSMVSRLAKEAEALPVMKQVTVLESAYRARSGAYTADLNRLEGWSAPTLRYHSISISSASDTHLCVEATPLPEYAAERLSPSSMDERGRYFRSSGCVFGSSGMTTDSSGFEDAAPVESSDVPGEEVAPATEGPASVEKPNKL
jgi:hypothetical protein